MRKHVIGILRKMGRNIKGMALANQVVGIIVALFVVGAIGGTALVMVATSGSNMTAGGVPSSVVIVWTVAIPILAGVAIMLYFMPKRG